jgi:hypothetical protein
LDKAARRMQWDADQEQSYAGWLAVSGDKLTSQVTLHLTIPDNGSTAGLRPRVRESILRTLESIQNIVEGRGRKFSTDPNALHGVRPGER